jgi:endonuclease/exonuclease/phosphatase family metal-dependent hydrolase
MRLTRIAPLLAAATLLTACPGEDFTQVRVMTQNLAIGIELEPVLLAPDMASIPPLVDTAWAQKDQSDFALRAGRLADAIQASGADVVGLQEVIQFFSGTSPPATTPAQDFLQLLLAELSSRGLSYALADDGTDSGVVSNADITLPGTAGLYRVVDREAVLVRNGVTVSDVRRGNFTAHLALEIGGTVPFQYERGWVALDAVKEGKAFTFVSTHLEPFDARVQSAQTTELLALVDPRTPTILVGDFNSDPHDPAWPAYGMLVSPTTGFSDSAAEKGVGDATCCRDALCADPAAPLERRVDLVLHSQHFQTASVSLHGAAAADYSAASGTWPADHAGVSAVLEIE